MKRSILTIALALILIPFVHGQDIKLKGTISAENNQIKNVTDPTDAKDAATKSYVDTNVNSFSGSYNDLSEIPLLYTQAEVDALIARLQSQIDALQPTSVTDQDGNTYDFLTYGDQVWTVENAEMVTYRDGTEIPQVTDATEWSNLTTGAWCYYDNDPAKGKLYNWYAVMGIHDAASLSDSTLRKEFSPEGWHVPTNDEWTTLENYLIANGYNYDQTTTKNKIGKAMASTIGWDVSSITGAPGNEQSLNNSSGFNALPEGYRNNSGSFFGEATHAYFWSVTEYFSGYIWNRYIYASNIVLGSFCESNLNGFSVRFVRD